VQAHAHASTHKHTHTDRHTVTPTQTLSPLADVHVRAHALACGCGWAVCAYSYIRPTSLPPTLFRYLSRPPLSKTHCALPWIHSFFLPPVWMRNSDAEFSFPICSICGGSEMLALIAGCVCNSCDINLHAVVLCVVLCYQRDVHVAAVTSVSLLHAQFLCLLLSVNHPLPSTTPLFALTSSLLTHVEPQRPVLHTKSSLHEGCGMSAAIRRKVAAGTT
jgi:hypothetical protein